ncbi:hypothetical protein GGR54DRAFT_607775 [Hypoxylon sp. NC1633]|nr:hypothetical protein GGR54DRAFT_607775 [Hypoxylon sp. NC1633]
MLYRYTYLLPTFTYGCIVHMHLPAGGVTYGLGWVVTTTTVVPIHYHSLRRQLH